MRKIALIIGGGPAGLFAAETLAVAGLRVVVVDRMPSLGRKFLMAGRGGLNLTHSETVERFKSRYGESLTALDQHLDIYPAQRVIDWAEGLGQSTFVGSSGRVFPKAMKASPLLRAWLARLTTLGVTFALRRRWLGWDITGQPLFATHHNATTNQDLLSGLRPDVTILALGGASWPRLGSDGQWATPLAAAGVTLTPFTPSNVGVVIPWSEPLLKHAGEPLKRIAVSVGDKRTRGEAMITKHGLEGGAIYALSPQLRDALASGEAELTIDFRPDLSEEILVGHLSKPRGKQSMSNHVRKAAGITPAAIALVRESREGALPNGPRALAFAIKNATLKVTSLEGLDRAISTAGGVAFSAVDGAMMLKARPGVFVAGEMLDWDAPTGGYLLQATFATANAAAHGALRWLANAENT
ncbi:MAG: TIGR03862 family flavoprotein [Hyphomicrobiaceae bacterium]|nr:TIGR03862 family flavoprotein [Hyphomicrobiaceae bacterium]